VRGGLPDLPVYRELQAVRPGLIELQNRIIRCKNLNDRFGFRLEPADLDNAERWPPELLDVAEALIVYEDTKPKRRR
jgi:hypothetical protein